MKERERARERERGREDVRQQLVTSFAAGSGDVRIPPEQVDIFKPRLSRRANPEDSGPRRLAQDRQEPGKSRKMHRREGRETFAALILYLQLWHAPTVSGTSAVSPTSATLIRQPDEFEEEPKPET